MTHHSLFPPQTVGVRLFVFEPVVTESLHDAGESAARALFRGLWVMKCVSSAFARWLGNIVILAVLCDVVCNGTAAPSITWTAMSATTDAVLKVGLVLADGCMDGSA